jgi:hypothetical protein
VIGDRYGPAIEVNAFQSHFDVVIQRSAREGFGLAGKQSVGRRFLTARLLRDRLELLEQLEA